VTDPFLFGFPRVQIQSFSTNSFQLGCCSSWPKIIGPDGVYNILDHVSYLRGNHAFKFGGEVLLKSDVNNIPATARGVIRFKTLQNFFAGVPNRVQTLSGNVKRNLANEGYAAFVQDDWRVKPRLTVNLGLRYEYNSPIREANDLLGSFSPTLGLVQLGKQLPSLYNSDYKDIAPRLGIAWDIGGNGKTVLRAGGGIMYSQLSYDLFAALGNLVGTRVTPTGADLFVNGVQIPSPGTIAVKAQTFTGKALSAFQTSWQTNGPNNPLFGSITPACGDGTPLKTPVAGVIGTPSPCFAVGVDPNLRSPYVSTWTVDLQRAITNNLSLEVGYVGNHGTKMIGLHNLNQPAVGAGWTPAAVATCLAPAALYQNCAPDAAAIQSARPYNSRFPYLNYIPQIFSGYNSNYNSMQVTATQRNSHGLSFTVGYTYSHALDMASDNWGNTLLIPSNNNGNVKKELYGSSVFDIRQRFTLSVTYALPGVKTPGHFLEGWSVNSITTLQTGTPWFMQDVTTDFSGTGEIAEPTSARGEQWDFFGNPNDFQSVHGLTPGSLGSANPKGGLPYFASTSNPACLAKARALDGGAATGLAQAALSNLGCYAAKGSILIPPAYGTPGNLGRNTFRDTGFKNVDLSVTKVFKFKERLTAQFRAEFFNILNHPNFANPYGGPGGPTASLDPSSGPPFAYSSATPDAASSNPVLGAGGARAVQLGLKFIF
jgi:TonB-dependent receptor-like protein